MYEVNEEYLQITGFATPAEYQAYEIAREHEESTIVNFIEQWNGATNSYMGNVLSLIVKKCLSDLYSKIEHGDEEHRAWLKKAINEFYETNYNKKV